MFYVCRNNSKIETYCIMDDRHRSIIKENLEGLTVKTDYDLLLKLCVQEKILSAIMRDNLQTISDEKKRHRELFIKITKRGPQAFNGLGDICKEYFPSAEKILRPKDFQSISKGKILKSIQKPTEDEHFAAAASETRTILRENFNNTTSHIALEIYTRETKHDPKIIVQKSFKIHYDEKVPTYPMRSRNRGVFFMINIITFPRSTSKFRQGATMDGDNLVHLFREFGFEVFYYENLSLEQFHLLLAEILQSEYTRKTECFIMALMSHGAKYDKEHVEFYDSAHEAVDNIIQKFGNGVCPNLLGKPKILFFPFCRGEVSDKGTYAQSLRQGAQTDGISRNPEYNHPSISDLMICYATVPGYETHRDPVEGSWYVQSLCEVWAKHAHNTDIEKLQKLVGEKTGNNRLPDGSLQTSSQTVLGFYKTLYFNPGFYENK